MRTEPVPIIDKRPIVTASIGKNAEQFRDILRLYVPEGSTIVDCTFGNGYFWKLIDNSKYTVLASDLSDRIFNPQVHAFDKFLRVQADMTRLPYRDHSVDVLVCDPPYGKTGGQHRSFGVVDAYNLNARPGGMKEILRLYRGAANEADRVVKYPGLTIVKLQDAIESGNQWWMHSLVRYEFELCNFKLLDLFIFVQDHTPIPRYDYQVHAAKNHSFWLIMNRETKTRRNNRQTTAPIGEESEIR